MPKTKRPNSPPYDVIVWGATGFTGKLTAEVLLTQYGLDAGLRWGIAGRSAEKLNRIKGELSKETGLDASAIPTWVGDSQDEAFLEELCGQTKVICSTVGPYAQYGSKLVATCVEKGISYCDLTGEVHWMKEMIETHQEAAEESGARIVFNCGFDCIPSDLGVYFLQKEMRARHDATCAEINLRVKGFSGAASGGTIASMLGMLEEAEGNPEVQRAMSAPYSLNPEGEQWGPDRAERSSPAFDADLQQWTAPFVMATINTKVVRRSNALLDYAYGEEFRYDEAMLTGRGPAGLAKAAAMSVGSGVMTAAMSLGPLRRFAADRVPQPGDGPSADEREAGYFDLRLRGRSQDGIVLRARVRGDRDPGYGSTSRMLAESAVCLAQDDLEVEGGLWTPASAMGDALLERLPKAGVTFEIEN
ncbi:MAG: trans-acting enoyl reductase family protein [Myxococcota bacterium]